MHVRHTQPTYTPGPCAVARRPLLQQPTALARPLPFYNWRFRSQGACLWFAMCALLLARKIQLPGQAPPRIDLKMAFCAHGPAGAICEVSTSSEAAQRNPGRARLFLTPFLPASSVPGSWAPRRRARASVVVQEGDGVAGAPTPLLE